MAKKTEEKIEEAFYTKEQIVTSKRFRNNADLVDALLEDGKSYKLTDVESKIEKYMKGKVN